MSLRLTPEEIESEVKKIKDINPNRLLYIDLVKAGADAQLSKLANMSDEKLLGEIAIICWEYDRKLGIAFIQEGCNYFNASPLAIPKLALSMEINSVYYGNLARQISVLLQERLEKEIKDATDKERIKWIKSAMRGGMMLKNAEHLEKVLKEKNDTRG